MNTNSLAGYLVVYFLSATVIGLGCGSSTSQQRENSVGETVQQAHKTAIVLVAFGTSSEKARKVFDFIEESAKKRYPNHDIFWAYTSSMIISKLRAQGIDVKNPSEALSELKEAGYKAAVMQSLHVVPGQEFAELQDLKTSGLQIAIGEPLLATDKDIQDVIEAVEPYLKTDRPNVFVGHGNEHHLQYNEKLIAFRDRLMHKHSNTFTCTVEGQPGIGDLEQVKQQTKAKVNSGVHFIPLMIVAGDHIMNDVMGDDAESWKNIVSAAETTCDIPLGYNEKVLSVYFNHLDQALTTL